VNGPHALPRLDPPAAGVDAARLQRVGALVAEGAERGLYLGASWLLLRHGGVAASGVAGLAQEEPRRPVGPETVFDLASLTKPLVTATAVLLLAEAGAFHLDEPVARFLPAGGAAADSPLAGISLRHLLTHTSGLPAWRQYHSRGLERAAILAEIARSARERPIGVRYVYSDLGYILLGAVVELVAGQPLERIATGRILAPLGMAATTYRPPASWRRRVAATRSPHRPGALIGVVHDDNCASMGGVAGHAGLFSTASDVARYAAMLLAGGRLGGTRLLGRLAVRRMAENQLPPGVGGATLGWFAPPNGMLPAGDFLPTDCFGHTGFTGTSLLLCPSLDLAVVLLTNRVYQERDAGDFLTFRRRFHNTVAAAVQEAGCPEAMRPGAGRDARTRRG
jgi:CubicO group peptidase (beta-lactamase class C family)